MSWDKDKRHQPSRSGANSPENTAKVRNVSGTTDAATARIAAALGPSDTQASRDRLRLYDWKDDAAADRLLERVEAGDDFNGTLTPTQRIEMGLRAEAKRKVQQARRRLGGDDAA